MTIDPIHPPGLDSAPSDAMQARVWLCDGPESFPEHTLGVVPRPRTGICISGGGTRSLSAGLGQLRGLARLGLLERVGYCSTVSGGAICGTGYTFARQPSDDAVLMGTSLAPGELSWEGLLGRPPALGEVATGDLAKVLWKLIESDVPRDQIWIRAIGEVYLEPLGLDGEGAPPHYALDEAQLRPLLDRNPSLSASDFALVREAGTGGYARPFLIVNSTLMWPVGDLRKTNLVGCQTTPLYFGSAAAVSLRDADLENPVGGGFVDAVAAGCVAPSRLLRPPPDGAMQWVDVPGPIKPYTLTDATATSGASFARQLAPIDPDFAPEMTYWPVLPDTELKSAVYDFGDGGNIENYGLIALLLRGVERIVVFINTSVPLEPRKHFDAEHPPRPSEVDDVLPQLFGVPLRQWFGTENPYPKDQVFAREDFGPVVGALQVAKRSGNGAVARTTLRTVDNEWWGLEGGREVEILWFYLDRVPAWEARLPSTPSPQTGRTMKNDIELGHRRFPWPSGPVVGFPNYKSVGQNPGKLLELTNQQVNMLSALTDWWVGENEELLGEFLR